MPELPDVETVARTLRREAVGRRIRRVRVLSRSTVRSPAPARFASRLRGRRIEQVGRRGKYLLFGLEGDQTLIVHLRMTGGFASASRTDPIHPHTRVVFSFNGDELRFVDQRRFGHMDLVSARDVPAFPGLRRLGVEPLEDTFTLRKFRALLRGRRGTVKGSCCARTSLPESAISMPTRSSFRPGSCRGGPSSRCGPPRPPGSIAPSGPSCGERPPGCPATGSRLELCWPSGGQEVPVPAAALRSVRRRLLAARAITVRPASGETAAARARPQRALEGDARPGVYYLFTG